MGLPDRDRIRGVDVFIFRVRSIDSPGEWKSYLRNLINKLTIFFFLFISLSRTRECKVYTGCF